MWLTSMAGFRSDPCRIAVVRGSRSVVADVFDSQDYRQDAANVVDSYPLGVVVEGESQPDSILVEPSLPKALVAVDGLGTVPEAVGASSRETYFARVEAEAEARTSWDSAAAVGIPMEEALECTGSGNPRPVQLKHISAPVDSQLVFAAPYRHALQNDKHLEAPSPSRPPYSLSVVVATSSEHFRGRCFRQ